MHLFAFPLSVRVRIMLLAVLVGLHGFDLIGLRSTAQGAEASIEAVSNVAEYNQFDVVIAGGSTAALAAAIASAECGARTALLEPTDWVGGQLTASGVPAVDEAWHTIVDQQSGRRLLSVSELARDPRNITPNFLRSLQRIQDGGDCWVSRFCFRPRIYLQTQWLPLQQQLADHLVVFHETVVKQVEVEPGSSKVRCLKAIRRRPADGLAARGYDRLPSQEIADWYSPSPSSRFQKQLLSFGGRDGSLPVFIDATEWGEVLALSGADYLQGAEEEEGVSGGNDTCGQATVFCFVQKIHANQVEQIETDATADHLGFGDYRDKQNAWELIWSYRRIRGHGKPAPGDLCLQNWGYSLRLEEGGNDYPFGYLFKSRQETAAETRDWQGGVNLSTLAAAEQRALAWHHWFRKNAPDPLHPDQISLESEELGTAHGLAKLPYVRDTRRSMGLDGFVLKFADLTGPASQLTGTVFPDRIALGAYPADVHPLSNCSLPQYVLAAHDTLPFYLPFRALTHYQYENLLVAGKTMAQSFLANSATRLHPIEWSSGTAAGVAAAHMAQTGKTTREVFTSIEVLQNLVRQHTPIQWTVPKPAEQ